MERTVPSTESEEIELYTRTYYSLLRSSTEVRIRTLEEVHAGMNSLLHPGAREVRPDMPAFIYSLLRLPACLMGTQLVVMGQSPEVFIRAGFSDVSEWAEVSATARRRRCYYDGKSTLAVIIASRSDIDDLIPLLTAYQIEWNKLHHLLQRLPASISLEDIAENPRQYSQLDEILETPMEDIERLYAIWGEELGRNLEAVAAAPRNLRVQLLSGSLSEYRRATHAWWNLIARAAPEINERPIFFVSSNPHSLVNLLSGGALRHADELVDFIHGPGNQGLLNEWNDIQAGRVSSNRENFLYYVMKKYLGTMAGARLGRLLHDQERALGIRRIASVRSFDVEAQVISLKELKPEAFDPRLHGHFQQAALEKSKALILNIDYPLGLSAYNILSEVSEHVGSVLGGYIMGKAASLNAVMGDVMIPNVVHDEHSQNTYLFHNCFHATDVAPYLMHGTALDNQKAVSVQGTFLQNHRYMDVFYREGYTDIEMEAGPYLSAMYEMFRPTRHPVNEIVNLYGAPFEIGLLHYASDTPLNKGRNLGAGSLSYYGMDATYATSVAILKRIFSNL
jgi:hypothetical protein